MADSPSRRAKNANTTTTTTTTSSSISSSRIPIEIVSEEEMAFFEAALAATRSCFSSSSIPSISSPTRSSSLFQNNVRSIRTITSLSKKRLMDSDIEDFGDLTSTQKKKTAQESFFNRFRKRAGLSVTDFTSVEWCQKQMEFVLCFGKRKVTKAMKAGHDRHVKLEQEVVKKVKVSPRSYEDVWALKLLNFVVGAKQLVLEGLTRELPLVGFLKGVCVVGTVDEIFMPQGENRNPIIVDTKTRVQDTLPAEPQRRNGRLQLMCYKYLWDNLVADKFPAKDFFDFFSLNPYYILSKEIRENAAKAGTPAETLDEMVRYFRNTCNLLLPADNEMILRYELQEDNSVLGEDQFAYDPDWFDSQIDVGLEFWLGQGEASFAPEEERWKCHFCQFASVCPINTISGTSSPIKSNDPNRSNPS